MTSLIVHDLVEVSHLDSLSRLNNVALLQFSPVSMTYRVYYAVADAFFAHIASRTSNDPDTCIWPKLTTITLTDHGKFDAGNGEGLLQLVRIRTAVHLNDRSLPRRLTGFTLDSTDSPPWLRAELKRIFGE